MSLDKLTYEAMPMMACSRFNSIAVLREDSQEGTCLVQDCWVLHTHLCVLGHQTSILRPLVPLHLPHGLQ